MNEMVFLLFKDIKYLEEGALIVQVWGTQRVPKEKKNMTTKEFLARRAEAMKRRAAAQSARQV